MPLVLTLRPSESFYVGHAQFTLDRIVSENKVQIRRVSDRQTFDVTNVESAEIEEDVIVSLGDRMTTKAARLVIDAPRSKLILSEDKYRRSNPR